MLPTVLPKPLFKDFVLTNNPFYKSFYADNIPNIRIGIIAHGDYYSEATTYLIKASNDYKFCRATDIDKLCDFVNSATATDGYDMAECYELVLRHAAERFDWTPGAQKSLVLIGDSYPHAVGKSILLSNGHTFINQIDWKIEAKKLYNKAIRVYAVQCLGLSKSTFFYKDLAQETGGIHLQLSQLSVIADVLVAVCYRESDVTQQGYPGAQLTDFMDEVQRAGRMGRELRDMFDRLLSRSVASGVSPVA